MAHLTHHVRGAADIVTLNSAVNCIGGGTLKTTDPRPRQRAPGECGPRRAALG